MSGDARKYRYRAGFTYEFKNRSNISSSGNSSNSWLSQGRFDDSDFLFPLSNNLTEKNLTNQIGSDDTFLENEDDDWSGISVINNIDLDLSTATLAVMFCVVVCIYFVLISLQSKFDADFMGGLIHALSVIILVIIILMVITITRNWPKLWYAGFGSFFLWFFHRMVVFPLIALIFPFQRLL